MGAVTLSGTTANLVSGTAKSSDPVTKVIYRSFEKVMTMSWARFKWRPMLVCVVTSYSNLFVFLTLLTGGC